MNPRLIAHSGPLTGQTLSLSNKNIVVGRDSSSGIPLADLAVSRQHCRLSRTGDDIRIVDLDSLNGTFVNGLPVKERSLCHGDQIKIGESYFIFLVRDEDELPIKDSVQWEEAAGMTGATIELYHSDAAYLQPASKAPGLPASPRVVRSLKALLTICQSIHSEQSTEKLANRLLSSVFDVVPAEHGVLLWRSDSAEDGFSILGRIDTRKTAVPLPVSRTVVNRVLRQKVAILNNQILGEAELKHAPSLILSRVCSLLAVPLLWHDNVGGLFYLVSRNSDVAFEQEHLQLLTAIAGMAAVALENASRFEELHQENSRLRSEINLEHNIVGESPRMRDVFQFIAKAAAVDSTVLIRGESGTGKELVARAIHQNSARRDKPFQAINCAALTESLLESELFGHEKYAFTHALTQKKGKLEVADGGTVFLDEVGELAPALQAKLLRVLQEREFERVGGTRPISVDVRIVAATNKNLEEAMKQNAFRQDLYFRLNVVSLTLPPLRDRMQDIPLLANYFVGKFARKSRRRIAGLSPEARSLLMSYDWPGNVRELENAVERAAVLGTSEVLIPEDFPDTLLEREFSSGDLPNNFHQAVAETKKQLIVRAFENARGNYTETAKILGLHPNYLHRLIRNLDLKLVLKQKAGSIQPSSDG